MSDKQVSNPGRSITSILDDPRVAVSAVIEALYLKDEAAGKAALSRLRTQLSADTALDLTDSQREVLSLYACWLEWQLTIVFRDEDRAAKREWLLAQLAQVQQTELGEVMRAKLELQLHINNEGPGLLSFMPDDFHAVYRRIPAEHRHGELMYYAASWAFRHRDLSVLEECFEHFTIYADGHISDYVWQYVNLMYQLMCEKAGFKDVVEHLKRMEFMHQLIQFELHIQPELERQGLLTAQLSEEIEQTRIRLELSPPHKPVPEAPTKRIRTNL
jgi:hypothetical protein